MLDCMKQSKKRTFNLSIYNWLPWAARFFLPSHQVCFRVVAVDRRALFSFSSIVICTNYTWHFKCKIFCLKNYLWRFFPFKQIRWLKTLHGRIIWCFATFLFFYRDNNKIVCPKKEGEIFAHPRLWTLSDHVNAVQFDSRLKKKTKKTRIHSIPYLIIWRVFFLFRFNKNISHNFDMNEGRTDA